MAPARLDVSELAAVLPPGGLTLVSSCSAESDLLAKAVLTAGPALGAMTFCGIFVPGLNRQTWLANAQCRVITFFQTPELKAKSDAVDFLPLCYADILSLLRRRKPDAALFMTSPPDLAGNCSFGTAVDFIADLWRDIPIRIAHINPSMPNTPGDPGVPFDQLTAYIEGDQALLGTREEEPGSAATSIAQHIAAVVPNGATLQTGLGKIPGAVLRALHDHRDLRLHSGLVGDAVLDLAEAGALAPGASITAGVAIGSPRLYAAVEDPIFNFQPVSITHDLQHLTTASPLVTINSALEVDLYGQVHAEFGPQGWMSGPGGASDFARAAREAKGIRIVALPALAGREKISRIVPAGTGAGPVSLGRMDVDLIVTEHGIADLRDKGHSDRARAIIRVADPSHREALAFSWSNTFSRH